MPDLAHTWGADLEVGATGDLATVDGLALSDQRILRRLLTNPGEYLSHPDYGAGLPSEIGRGLDDRRISALIRGQMALEATVSHQPEPKVVMSANPVAGEVLLSISYTYAPTGEPVNLTFTVGR